MDGNFHPTQAAKRACGGDNSWKPGTTMGNGKPPPPKRPRVPLQPFSGSGGGPMARQRAQLPIYDARAALITAVKENKSIIGAPWRRVDTTDNFFPRSLPQHMHTVHHEPAREFQSVNSDLNLLLRLSPPPPPGMPHQLPVCGYRLHRHFVSRCCLAHVRLFFDSNQHTYVRAVVGETGSGKTTQARMPAVATSLPCQLFIHPPSRAHQLYKYI